MAKYRLRNSLSAPVFIIQNNAINVKKIPENCDIVKMFNNTSWSRLVSPLNKPVNTIPPISMMNKIKGTAKDNHKDEVSSKSSIRWKKIKLHRLKLMK